MYVLVPTLVFFFWVVVPSSLLSTLVFLEIFAQHFLVSQIMPGHRDKLSRAMLIRILVVESFQTAYIISPNAHASHNLSDLSKRIKRPYSSISDDSEQDFQSVGQGMGALMKRKRESRSLLILWPCIDFISLHTVICGRNPGFALHFPTHCINSSVLAFSSMIQWSYRHWERTLVCISLCLVLSFRSLLLYKEIEWIWLYSLA